MRRKQSGFTLVEASLGLTVAAITLGLALPALGEVLDRQRVAAVHNSLNAALHLARSVAIGTRRRTVVCPVVDGQQQCRAGGVWDAGWMAFVDANANNSLDAGERLLRVEHRTPGGLRIRSGAGRPRVSFRGNGLSGGSNLTIRFCGRDGAVVGGLVVNNLGRTRRHQGGGACS